MADVQDKPRSKAVDFIANGGGAVTFRLLTTGMGALLILIVTWGLNTISTRFDKLDSAVDRINSALATANGRIDVHASRLDHLDTSDTELWTAVHSNLNRIDDHEHRISIMEGARSPH